MRSAYRRIRLSWRPTRWIWKQCGPAVPRQRQLACGLALRLHEGVYGAVEQPVHYCRAVRAVDCRLQKRNPVRLNELGKVFDSVTTARTRFWINGDPTMMLAVRSSLERTPSHSGRQ